MFNNIEYLIYSSHKTSTQSLMSIFKKNKIKIELYHNISNIPLLYPKISPINNIGCKVYYGWGENDINQKNYVDQLLTKQNFKRVYFKDGGWGPCQNNFFEVWKK